MLLESSVRERKVQSAKASADRNSTWADVQPFLASDSRHRWGSPLFTDDWIYRSQGHQEEVNVTDIAGAKSSCLSAQQKVTQLTPKEAHECQEATVPKTVVR